MPLKLNSSGGGSVTLDTPSTASAYTLTVPAITGTAVVTGSTGTVSTAMITDGSVTQAKLATGVAGNGPAFSAYQSGSQGVASNTWTKVILQTEEFDTANCFDNSSNYRFTPNVAGYYQLSGGFGCATTSTTVYLQFYKNGSGYKLTASSGSASLAGGFGSILVYLNGSTDYVELYCYLVTGQSLVANLQTTYFQGALVRAA